MLLRTAAATFGLALTGYSKPDDARLKKVLFFSKSSGYEHSVIKRNGGQLSFAEKTLAELGPKHGIDFVFSKDGSVFDANYIGQFDAFFFFTSGNLLGAGNDKNPPMTEAGKAALLDAIEHGKGFIGAHSATDTFETNEPPGFDTKVRSQRYHNYGSKADPYVRMIGAEFIKHDKQQTATQRVADSKFPGMPEKDFGLMEEWYSFADFSHDLHVLLVQETLGMTGSVYNRPLYPSTWARMHGKGRVFYTAMGHREETWTNPMFQQLLFGGISWAVGNVDADVRPNIKKVTPAFEVLPPQS